METIFSFTGDNLNRFKSQYKKIVSREFYDGELDAIGDDPINLYLEKGLEYPFSIVHLRTSNRITYRRSQKHIHTNQIEVYSVWIIRRGGVKVSRSSGTAAAIENQILIYDSSTPFFAELIRDEHGIHESLEAVVPAHMFREYLGGLSEFNIVLDSERGEAMVADRIIGLLAEQGRGLSRELSESLSKSLLQALGDALAAKRVEKARRSIADRRLEDIESFVARNLTNRDLSANLIAEACKISPRYLCYILKSAGYTFAQLVWDRRLERARAWLISPNMQSYLVHEIASMAGYTSAAHFSRAFKLAFGCTPTEYRQQAGATSEDVAASGFAEPLH